MVKKYVGGGDIITAKEVDDIVKARKQPMGTAPKGGMPEENDMGPLPKSEPKGYKPKDVSSKKPEPTFKSDVDNIVSGVKKGYTKIDDTLNKGFAKAAGKTEKGILNTSISKDYKQGGMIKKYSKGGTASARADGIATKGKTRGRII
jgi:hypothetical protein